MNQSFMKEKPVFPLLTSMALPMVISMLVNSLYNIIDSFFVAQISEQAMTALSLVYPVQNLINAIAIGFGVGMNALIALCLGAGDVKNADRAAPNDPGSNRYAVFDCAWHCNYRCKHRYHAVFLIPFYKGYRSFTAWHTLCFDSIFIFPDYYARTCI